MHKGSKIIILATVFVFGIALSNAAWSATLRFGSQTKPSLPQTPNIKRLSPTDLVKLRWIEGTWRGTGDVESPFFEKYHFENDSILVVESFSDGTLSKVTDVTRFELKEGQFGNSGEGARWAATRLDEGSILFEPVARARNTFIWEKVSKDEWKAVLAWPATETSAAKQRVYRMQRWPSSTQ